MNEYPGYLQQGFEPYDPIELMRMTEEKVCRGDKRSKSIAASSIVAKVLRDEMVVHLDRLFEGYSLARHKGYGTREHYLALQRLGPSVFHRKTFNLKVRADS